MSTVEYLKKRHRVHTEALSFCNMPKLSDRKAGRRPRYGLSTRCVHVGFPPGADKKPVWMGDAAWIMTASQLASLKELIASGQEHSFYLWGAWKQKCREVKALDHTSVKRAKQGEGTAGGTGTSREAFTGPAGPCVKHLGSGDGRPSAGTVV